MTKAMLCISITTLMILGCSVSTFALSFGGLPYISLKENSEETASIDEDMPMEDEEEVDLLEPLTLEHCIELALERAPGMRTAKLSLMLEEMNVKNARSNYLPQIDTSGHYQFSDAVDFGWERENYDASVSANYTIWDHGQREGTLYQAKLGRVSVHFFH